MKVVVPGYVQFTTPLGRGVAVESCAPTVRALLENDTLYAHISRAPGAATYHGRGPVYAADLGEGCGRVVVRHARRGGLFASLLNDLYFTPIRPVRELINSLRLRALGIPTPEIIAYVSYPAFAVLRRFDVVTREIPGARSLADALAVTDGNARAAAVDVAARAVEALSAVGAHHPDLNARNILVTGVEAEPFAILDVDTVRFNVPGSPMLRAANRDRLLRSLRKLAGRGPTLSEADITALAARLA